MKIINNFIPMISINFQTQPEPEPDPPLGQVRNITINSDLQLNDISIILSRLYRFNTLQLSKDKFNVTFYDNSNTEGMNVQTELKKSIAI